MVNILIPIGKKSNFFNKNEFLFPQSLIEINDKTIIQLVIENYETIKDEKRFIFIVSKEECDKYHIDNVLKLLTNYNSKIITLDSPTKGAVCSCLMAIEYIDNEDELIIANSDQIFNLNINNVLNKYREKDSDCGVISFESVHPRWSFVLEDENNKIIETAEKRPISKNAIAGFYYFKNGKSFINASMKSIKRDASIDDNYYIAPIINEMVLDNMNLDILKIDKEEFVTLYSPDKIKEYKDKLK